MAQINSQAPASGQTLRESGNPYNLADYAEMTMGGKGAQVALDTATYTATAGQSFVALQCITDVVIAAYTTRTYAPVTPTNALVGLTLPAGMIIYGQFLTVKLTSGSFIAYEGVSNAGA